DCIEQAIEIVKIGRIAAHPSHVAANQLDGLIERLLPPARDENVGTFFNEPLGARQRHAARSTRDDSNLTLKLSHDLLLPKHRIFVVRGSSNCSTYIEMDERAKGRTQDISIFIEMLETA